MGIIEFFGTLVRNKITSNAITTDFNKQIEINHFLIDFNSMVHTSSQKIIKDINNIFSIYLKAIYNKNKLNLLLITKYDVKLEVKKDMSVDDFIIEFHDKFDNNKLDELIIKETITQLYELFNTFFKKDDLQTILLAIDGVPSKGKLIEQKQRRYMAEIIFEYKKKLFKKNKEYLKKLPNYEYYAEKYAIIWWKTNITPGTLFMDKLYNTLNSLHVKKQIKSYFPNLKTYEISSMYEVGEGEKKIVNYVKKKLNETNDSVMVYSPDADVILLTLLLPVDKCYMLKYDPQNTKFDLINQKLLRENIGMYFDNKIDNKCLIKDIVGLITIFGNDFVPNIETLNVKEGFRILLDKYIIVYNELNKYLISEKDKKHHFNLDFLTKIFKELLKEEYHFLKYKSMYNKYLSYPKIRYVFGYDDITEDTITELVRDFHKEYNELQIAIRNNGKFTNTEFLNRLKRGLDIAITDNSILESLKKYYLETNEFPKLNFNLNTKTHSIHDNRYKMKIKEMNEHQKESFQFENMLDEYYEKLNNTPLEFDNYYEDMDMEKALSKYLEGLLWVVDYYFDSKAYVGTWYYPYERAPLLKDIVNYLSKLQKIDVDLKKYEVSDLDDYFNPIEQLIYVSPLSNIPEEFEILKENDFFKDNFIDCKKIAKELFNGNTNIIDCHSKPYLNKCIIKTMKRLNRKQDKEFLKIVRTIETTKKIKLLSKNSFPHY